MTVEDWHRITHPSAVPPPEQPFPLRVVEVRDVLVDGYVDVPGGRRPLWVMGVHAGEGPGRWLWPPNVSMT
jgi:hypothetical protein